MELHVGIAMLLAVLAYCYSCLVGRAATCLRFLSVEADLSQHATGIDDHVATHACRHGMRSAIRSSVHVAGDVLCHASFHNTCYSRSSAGHDCNGSWCSMCSLGLPRVTDYSGQLVCIPSVGRASFCSHAPFYTERSFQGAAPIKICLCVLCMTLQTLTEHHPQ